MRGLLRRGCTHGRDHRYHGLKKNITNAKNCFIAKELNPTEFELSTERVNFCVRCVPYRITKQDTQRSKNLQEISFRIFLQSFFSSSSAYIENTILKVSSASTKSLSIHRYLTRFASSNYSALEKQKSSGRVVMRGKPVVDIFRVGVGLCIHR